jgi:hypothetical protein
MALQENVSDVDLIQIEEDQNSTGEKLAINNNNANNNSIEDSAHTKHHILDAFKQAEAEKPQGPIGKAVLSKHRFIAYYFFGLIPIAFIIAMLSAVPLSNPEISEVGHNAVLLFAFNPVFCGVLSYLYSAVHLQFNDVKRPFFASIVPALATIVVQVGVFTGFYSITGAYSLAGVVALGLSMLTTLFALYVVKLIKRNSDHDDLGRFALRVLLPLFLFVMILGLYAVVFQRMESSVTQAFMIIAISFVTFFARRIQLSLLDNAPLVISMLWAGFCFQSLNDFVRCFAIFFFCLMLSSVSNLGISACRQTGALCYHLVCECVWKLLSDVLAFRHVSIFSNSLC